MDDLIESPNKYGKWEDDLTDLARGLAGGPVSNSSDSGADSHAPDGDAVTKDFLRTLRGERGKYGE